MGIGLPRTTIGPRSASPGRTHLNHIQPYRLLLRIRIAATSLLLLLRRPFIRSWQFAASGHRVRQAGQFNEPFRFRGGTRDSQRFW